MCVLCISVCVVFLIFGGVNFFFFFFQAEDGIRDVERSRGLGDVYKRQGINAEYMGDQTISESPNLNKTTYVGEVYSNEQINSAINAYRNNQDPYAIVPSKDEIGHGTKVAGIIGARGYSNEFQGVANGCEFVIVKLMESSNHKAKLEANGIKNVPVYNTSEMIAGLEYLKRSFFRLGNRPMVIYIGMGTTEGSHDASNLISRYITVLASIRGICMVTGVGNEGAAAGHATGYISSVGDSSIQELVIPREMKYFSFNIWVQKPNKASINIISPNGEASKLIKSKANKIETYKFVFTQTKLTISYRTPEYFTGHEVIGVDFEDIKPGIWRIQLVGEYIIGGRYDIWLPAHSLLPENLAFLEPNPYNTLLVPSTANNVVTVAYYGLNNTILAASGKGFNVYSALNIGINPDIATIGVNIITTQALGGVTTMSGSSAASAIIAGACALLLEWGIIRRNDTTMYSRKIISYLLYGANRSEIYRYPNKETGYGDFNLLGTFNIIGRIYNNTRNNKFSTQYNKKKSTIIRNKFDDEYIEYYDNELFIRISKSNLEDFLWKQIL
eukprot:TRINITY_DN2360_c0_g1_i16.p1 TRINITY_DN2360_c0_g1~~TRINITY_DN2360_c0_g1_i16.p1  ORF type:complete len:557 (+),score=81.86 TRINITY_DN2360_c0_g1_i16:41-1711(+)